MKRAAVDLLSRSALGRWSNWCLLWMLAVAGAVQGAEQPISLDTGSGRLAGTLALPAHAATGSNTGMGMGTGKPTVVLMIAGSGPTDRDGNSPGPQGRRDSQKMLAAALADAGVASVRYDKRGVGASAAAAPPESALRFDMLVDDAAAWIALLHADGRFAQVVVLGHSEGALTGLLAARRGGAAAYISVAGAADPVGVILRRQLAGKLTPAQAAVNERILAALEHGATTADVPPEFAALYRPSVQPYLISWMKYNPARELAALPLPTLIVQGSGDIQVGVDQARALAAAQPAAVLAILPDMNHVLKNAPLGSPQQMTSYSDPTLPLHPQLAPTIIDFLHKLPPHN